MTQLSIDWRAYFLRFCAEHGEYVEIDWTESDRYPRCTKLLFADGWRYGALDYQGPEYPPPKERDKLLKLQVEYWRIRKAKTEAEWKKLDNMRDSLLNWQATRSLPLQASVVYPDRTETGKEILRRSKPEDLDLSGLKIRLEELSYLLAECTERLEELTSDLQRIS